LEEKFTSNREKFSIETFRDSVREEELRGHEEEW
jgi:hypothetical protein